MYLVPADIVDGERHTKEDVQTVKPQEQTLTAWCRVELLNLRCDSFMHYAL